VSALGSLTHDLRAGIVNGQSTAGVTPLTGIGGLRALRGHALAASSRFKVLCDGAVENSLLVVFGLVRGGGGFVISSSREQRARIQMLLVELVLLAFGRGLPGSNRNLSLLMLRKRRSLVVDDLGVSEQGVTTASSGRLRALRLLAFGTVDVSVVCDSSEDRVKLAQDGNKFRLLGDVVALELPFFEVAKGGFVQHTSAGMGADGVFGGVEEVPNIAGACESRRGRASTGRLRAAALLRAHVAWSKLALLESCEAVVPMIHFFHENLQLLDEFGVISFKNCQFL
jgi:hypothetical protein